MSFFFHHPPSLEAEFTLKDPPDKGGIDTVLLSSRLWAHLSVPQDSRVLVHTSLGDSIAPLLTSQELEYLTCWASEDPEVRPLHVDGVFVSCNHYHKVECIAIPPHWSDLYPHIFGSFNGRRNLHLSIAEDISLFEVVLTAQTPDAYSFALSHGSALEEWLFNSSLVIRSGEELILPRALFLSNGNASEVSSSTFCSYRYKVDVAYPYSQGIVQPNVTQVMVACYDDGEEIREGTSTNGTYSSNPEPASEPVEINESFLITAALPASAANHSAPYEGECSPV